MPRDGKTISDSMICKQRLKEIIGTLEQFEWYPRERKAIEKLAASKTYTRIQKNMVETLWWRLRDMRVAALSGLNK